MEMVRIINSRTELMFPKRAVIFIKFAARYLTMQTDYPGIARLFLFANSVNAHGIYTPPRPGEYPARPSALVEGFFAIIIARFQRFFSQPDACPSACIWLQLLEAFCIFWE